MIEMTEEEFNMKILKAKAEVLDLAAKTFKERGYGRYLPSQVSLGLSSMANVCRRKALKDL